MKIKLVPFNVNSFIRVRLTDKGVEILRRRHQTLWEMVYAHSSREIPPFRLDTDDEGWTRFQMWDFIQVFGPVTGMGVQESYSTNIQIEFVEGR